MRQKSRFSGSASLKGVHLLRCCPDESLQYEHVQCDSEREGDDADVSEAHTKSERKIFVFGSLARVLSCGSPILRRARPALVPSTRYTSQSDWFR